MENKIEELAKWYCKEMGWRWDLLDDEVHSLIDPPSKETMRRLAREIVMQVELIWCKEILKF